MAKNKHKKNILELIRNHHDMLRENIDVIKDEDESKNERIDCLSEFMIGLKMHTKAEEEVFYDTLLEIRDIRPQFLEAQTEHNLTEQLMDEIEGSNFPDQWNDEIAAKGKVLVEMVEHHLDKEEDDLFADARNHLSRTELEELGEEYIQKCEEILDEIEDQPSLGTDSIESVKSHLYPS